jgi:hypothetical protein
MKVETQGWGDSMIATKYVYDMIHSFLDCNLPKKEINFALSCFLDQLAHNYKVDTGKSIGEEV